MHFNKGFALPLSLLVMLLILIVALWANRDAITELWASIAQREGTKEFYAAEAGLRWAIGNLLYTNVVDSLSDGDSLVTNIDLPVGGQTIPLTIEVKFIRISRNCGFKSSCCRLFEIKSLVNNGPFVKALAVKDIPNPKQDENAKKVCLM